MRVTQGTFSYLPDFTDEEIAAQVRYAMEQDWALAVEFTDDAHPRNVYWEMWGQPIFDTDDPVAVVAEVEPPLEDRGFGHRSACHFAEVHEVV